MDTQTNVQDLNDYRDETELLAPEHLRRPETQAASAKSVASTAFGSGWYHDAAIEVSRKEAIETRCRPAHW